MGEDWDFHGRVLEGTQGPGIDGAIREDIHGGVELEDPAEAPTTMSGKKGT